LNTRRERSPACTTLTLRRSPWFSSSVLAGGVDGGAEIERDARRVGDGKVDRQLVRRVFSVILTMTLAPCWLALIDSMALPAPLAAAVRPRSAAGAQRRASASGGQGAGPWMSDHLEFSLLSCSSNLDRRSTQSPVASWTISLRLTVFS
jgi:hypothetical protein